MKTINQRRKIGVAVAVGELADGLEVDLDAVTNQCRMLKFTFENGNICYSGNKCEKYFFNRSAAEHKGVNAFDSKNKLIFSA